MEAAAVTCIIYLIWHSFVRTDMNKPNICCNKCRLHWPCWKPGLKVELHYCSITQTLSWPGQDTPSWSPAKSPQLLQKVIYYNVKMNLSKNRGNSYWLVTSNITTVTKQSYSKPMKTELKWPPMICFNSRVLSVPTPTIAFYCVPQRTLEPTFDHVNFIKYT